MNPGMLFPLVLGIAFANTAGDTMVGFHAEGKSQPTFVTGGGSPHMSR